MTGKWTRWRLIATILATIVFLVLTGLAIWNLIQINHDYKNNSVATVVKLHENENISLSDIGVCVPLGFLTSDEKLVEAAKFTLFHDPSFVAKALHAVNKTAIEKYWAIKNSENKSIAASDLIESFLNETLKPFLKNFTAFPEENAMDKFLSDESEIFDIIETSDGKFVNKTILLASVALIDLMTQMGKGQANPGVFAIGGITQEDIDRIIAMAKSLLDDRNAANLFTNNVAKTLCEIFTPEWANIDRSEICGSNGSVITSPSMITLDEFCFNVPISTTSFSKKEPSATLSVSLPLAQTIFSLGPLSDSFNLSSLNSLTQANISVQLQSPNQLTFPFNFSLENGTFPQNQISPSLFNLPFLKDANPNFNLNFSIKENETQKLQMKFQHEVENLLKSDILSLAFKFPLILSRKIKIYFPNDMKYYSDSETDPNLNADSESSATTTADEFNSKIFTYELKPKDLIDPKSEAIFGISKSKNSISTSNRNDRDQKCSDEISNFACLNKCNLKNIKNYCNCLPFGLRQVVDSDSGQLSTNRKKEIRYCTFDDQNCLGEVKDEIFSNPNASLSVVDCKETCKKEICSVKKYKWRDPKLKKKPLDLIGNIDAMISGRPTQWSWKLNCDSFDFIEYVEKELITWPQYLSQIGGVLGFYSTIFGLFLLLLYLINLRCCNRNRDRYDVPQQILTQDIEYGNGNGYFGKGNRVPLNGDMKKFIEDTVAEILNKKLSGKMVN